MAATPVFPHRAIVHVLRIPGDLMPDRRGEPQPVRIWKVDGGSEHALAKLHDIALWIVTIADPGLLELPLACGRIEFTAE